MLTNILKENFPDAIVDAHTNFGDETVVVKRERIFSILQFLKTLNGSPFNLLLDICGVDHLTNPDPLPGNDRFEVVYHLYSMSAKKRIRIKVRLTEADASLPSAIKIWEAADWFEREAFDMYGIKFVGHPNLKRILMWDAFEGHPLRKDYPMEKRQPIPVPSDIV